MTKDHDKIIRIEEKQAIQDEKLDLIMTNHLPHLQDKVDKIDKRLTQWGAVLVLLGFLVPYILPHILDKLFR